jgi:hypothetical protein
MDFMLNTYSASTMNELHTKMCMDLVMAPAQDLDMISQVDVAKYNVMAYADSMTYNHNIKSIWVGKSRWTMMVNQYLDRDELTAWLAQASTKIGTKGRGQAVLRTKVVKPRGGAATGHTNKESRRWGSCMLSLTYKAIPQPTITLHSRTSYIGYLAVLDFNIAHVVARALAAQLGIKVEDFAFVWMVESVQWHGFKSMAWLLCNEDETIRNTYRRLLIKKMDDLDEDEQTLATTPAMVVTRKWVNYVRREDQRGNSYGETNYNTYRRIRRRWHTEVFGYERGQKFEGWSHYKKGHPKEGQQREFFKAYAPLPDVFTENLDLRPLGMKIQPGGINLVPVEEIDVDGNDCFACGEVDNLDHVG